MIALSSNLFLFSSTCHVYIIRNGEKAVLIDFGDGSVLNDLESLGINEVTAILMTHHHRDQAQGLQRAVETGIPIWVPDMECELFSEVNWHWQSRNIMNNYNVQKDRFLILQSVSISGVLRDYEQLDFGGIKVEVIPTPGHTPGSISLAAEIDGINACFSGDLIAGPGKLWSLAATQWTYNGAEGVAYSALSLLQIRNRGFDRLFPSHGEVMDKPTAAIDLLVEQLLGLIKDRGEQKPILTKIKEPYQQITPHVYRNLTSVANSYVVVSDSGKAFIIDYGYDFCGGLPTGTDRASRRPWLYTIPLLKEKLGVNKIDVVLPTHYHDDHVAGMNLLQRVEGTAVWAPKNFVDVLEHPQFYDLPCLWFDPIIVDVVQPLGQKIQWEEFELSLFALPGHTRYAVAILLEADGKRILFSGDQYQGDDGLIWNYVYQNRYAAEDYRTTADLYQELQPDIILSGHWSPLVVDEEYYKIIRERGKKLEEYHHKLLPDELVSLGTDGTVGRLTPYHSNTRAGETVVYSFEFTNPADTPQMARVDLILPKGWRASPSHYDVFIEAKKQIILGFHLHVPETQRSERRMRIAAEITIGQQMFGQQAEALIDVVEEEKLESVINSADHELRLQLPQEELYHNQDD